MAVPADQTIIYSTYVGFGTQGNERTLLDFDEPATTVGNAAYTTTLELAASATDTSLDLSTVMDSCSAIIIRELSGNTAGAKYGPAAGAGNKFNLGASTAVVLRLKTDDTPPVLYFSNPDSVNKLFLEVSALGKRS